LYLPERVALGHDAIHTRDLPAQNTTGDERINVISLREKRVVISKDLDFYYSHILQQKPWKLLLIRTGNIRTQDLKQLFQANPTFSTHGEKSIFF